MSINEIIWQPVSLYQPHHSFDILLNREFAVEMAQTILVPEAQRRMNELGAEITNRFNYHEKNPYQFHEDTAFIRQINVDGGDAVWLAVENLYGRAPDLSSNEPLVYRNNNMFSSSDTLALLGLFDLWVSYSDVLKNYSK